MPTQSIGLGSVVWVLIPTVSSHPHSLGSPAPARLRESPKYSFSVLPSSTG